MQYLASIAINIIVLVLTCNVYGNTKVHTFNQAPHRKYFLLRYLVVRSDNLTNLKSNLNKKGYVVGLHILSAKAHYSS